MRGRGGRAGRWRGPWGRPGAVRAGGAAGTAGTAGCWECEHQVCEDGHHVPGLLTAVRRQEDQAGRAGPAQGERVQADVLAEVGVCAHAEPGPRSRLGVRCLRVGGLRTRAGRAGSCVHSARGGVSGEP